MDPQDGLEADQLDSKLLIKKLHNSYLIRLFVWIVLRKIFNSFDNSGKGSITTGTVGTIFQTMGIKVSAEALQRIIEEVDEDGKFEK